jgi:uncharacterized protein
MSATDPADKPPSTSDKPPNTSGDAAAAGESISAVFDRIEKLLEFPVEFPMKVIGKRVDGFAQQIADLVMRHVPEFDPASIELRPSSKGAYLSLTVSPIVRTRAQLEALYTALSRHPMVRIIL